jgi:uncharacterized repeat protein (TIGR01451 family)
VGSPVGFTVTVANSSAPDTATATDVTVNDPLPSGSGMDWSLSPYSGPGSCTLSGPTGSQDLTCSLGDMAPGSSVDLHIESSTGPASAGSYTNTATATATATTTTDAGTASAGTTIAVEAPALSVTVTAPSDFVESGSPIAYQIFVTNSSSAGTATATDVTIGDPLPSGPGFDWTISSSGGGCSVGGPVGTQVLMCDLGDMAPGSSASVTVRSDTTAGSDGTYLDTTTVSATDSLNTDASASVVVTTDAITSPARVTDDAGSPLSFSVTTTGGPVPSITETGKLPKHVTFVDNGDGTATISGTPKRSRPRTFHLTVRATFGTSWVSTQKLTLRIARSSSAR